MSTLEELCAGLDATIAGWRKQADEWDRKHGGPHDDECERSRMQRGRANEIAFLVRKARTECQVANATIPDLVECWEGEATRCDENAKRLGGGWAARAKTLRDCANTLKGLVKP